MTLVWLGLILALIVWAAVFMVWDVGYQFRKQQRALTLAGARGARRSEDQAWAANRSADHQLALTIARTRAELDATDHLVDALAKRPVRLEVLA